MIAHLTLSVFFAVGLLFSNPGIAASASDSVVKKDTLVISRVSTNPKKHYKHLKAIVDYLANNLQDQGISQGKVVFAKDTAQMVRYIRQGKVDLVTDTVFSAAMYVEKAGADVLLRRWKKGYPEYSSVIFSREESQIESLSDLVGRKIAFQDAESTSSFFIPASILIEKGFRLYQLDNPRESPPADMIGYVFANKEINISAWVNKGVVDAGAFSNINWMDEEDMPAAFRDKNRIIYESSSFPRALELVRHDLDDQLRLKIKEILVGAHDNEDGQAALESYQETLQFDEFPNASETIIRALELQQIVDGNLL